MNPVPFSQLTPHGQNQHMLAQLNALRELAGPDRQVNIVINLNSDGLIHLASSTSQMEITARILQNCLTQYATAEHRTVRPGEQN